MIFQLFPIVTLQPWMVFNLIWAIYAQSCHWLPLY